jgi:hypothetical protein
MTDLSLGNFFVTFQVIWRLFSRYLAYRAENAMLAKKASIMQRN